MSDEKFVNRLGEAVRLPVPDDFAGLVRTGEQLLRDPRVRIARLTDSKLDKSLKKMEAKLKAFAPLAREDRIKLAELLDLAHQEAVRRRQSAL